MTKYKIGDKVIIASKSILKGIGSVTPPMLSFALEIMTVYKTGYSDYYFKEDTAHHFWVEDTIIRLATDEEVSNGCVDMENHCLTCGKEIKSNERTVEFADGKMCSECVNKYTICEDCGRAILVSESEDVNGRTVCHRCKNSYALCALCGTYHKSNELELVDSVGCICKECVSKMELRHCNYCHGLFSDDKLIEDNGEWYCQDCYDIKNRAIHEYHYGHDFPVVFFGSADKNALYMGAEIEIDSRNYVDEDEKEVMAKEIKRVMPTNFVSMETDGSLDNGFENITMPATMEYHHSIMSQYKDMFNIAIEGGMTAHKVGTCGLHVHFNRSFYEDREEECLAKLLYLVETHWDNLVKFSRRNYRQLERWANKYTKSPEEVIKDMKDGRAERYSAINLTNENTIEFRLFRGTLRLESYIATLQLVDTMVKSSKSTNIEDLRKMQFTDFLLYPEIKDYWETVKNRQVR